MKTKPISDSTTELTFIHEPSIEVGMTQSVQDPRDGLTLFGPFESAAVSSANVGVIGTEVGIRLYSKWVERIAHPIVRPGVVDSNMWAKKPPFLGFKETFGVEWNSKPQASIVVHEAELENYLFLDQAHIRVQKVVDYFVEKIRQFIRSEDSQLPTIWFIVLPDYVKKYCRPKSNVESSVRVPALGKMRLRDAQRAKFEPFLLTEMNQDAVPYQMSPDFHHQLKAALLRDRILTQIVLESTINYAEFNAEPSRQQLASQTLDGDKAWNLCSALYYKIAGRPWRLGKIRPGVCYIGLVFKRQELDANPDSACCAAQMFLDSGDGVVFRGHVGPWYTGKLGDFHLSKTAAHDLLKEAVTAYREKHGGRAPDEVFIHGRTVLNENELSGFQSALEGTEAKLVGVQILLERDVRLFRVGVSYPILRGAALLLSATEGLLWTKGYVPRMRRYPGREVPAPIRVKLSNTNIEIEQVLTDILGLTKLNYNSCTFGDGEPITLKFADAIGQILTCGRDIGDAPLQFRHYI